jgi:23S rRNA (guanine745-N1)-methyltransferase
VSSLQPRPGHWLLRCPFCKSGFTDAAGALVCRNGHSFDLAREGYVNLISGRRRRPAASGDSPTQLRHRAEFLNAGHVDAVAAMVAAHVEEVPYLSRHVLDAGSGTGHHLARIVARLPGTVIGLGLDISKDAARQAARHWPAPAFAVADLWADWPVRDAAVDLVVSIFAPKDFPETARVLRRGGWFALAHPGPEHLTEFRDRFGLLRQDEESPGRYADMATRFVGPSSVTRLHHRAILDPAMVRAAILMGPNARHVDPSTLDVGPHPLTVTFDINVLFARKTERKS